MNGSYTNPTSLPLTPDDWQVVAIKDICTKVTSGATPLRSQQKYFVDGTYSWFKTQELHDNILSESQEKITKVALDETSVKLFPKGTVLMAMYGDGKTITSLGLLSKESTTNQACCAMIPNNNLCDSHFLFYALKMHRNDFVQIATGGAQRNLSAKLIKNFSINIPPLDEQRGISYILKAFDDKIELNRQINTTLEQMAQAIFKHWFIDFEFPDENGQPYRSNGGEMVDSELGEIPAGWEVKPIGDILELAYGKSLTKKKRVPGPYPVYGSGGISGYHNEPLLNGPGIVVGRKGTIGSVYWVEDDYYPIDTVFYVNLKSEIPLYWIFMSLQRMNIARLSSDSAVPGVNRNVIHFQKWIIPKKTILDEFNSVISSMLDTLNNSKQEVQSLSEMRDILLPKLMSGKIRISEIEKWEREGI